MRDEYYLDTEDVGNQVETLIKQRVPYEDFWRVLANDYNDSIASKEGRYWARSWDTGNWWSMLKRNALDKKADLQGYYSKAKAVKISEEAGKSSSIVMIRDKADDRSILETESRYSIQTKEDPRPTWRSPTFGSLLSQCRRDRPKPIFNQTTGNYRPRISPL